MSLPYFPMYPSDFEAKTSHLTLEEDGAYNRLLRLMWMTPGCSLPNDDAWIMRRMRCDQETYDRVVRVVISEFCERKDNRVSNAKLTRVFDDSISKHGKRVSAGSAGGKAKALQTNTIESSNATAMLKQPEPEPEPEPEPDIRKEVDANASPVISMRADMSDVMHIFNDAAGRAGWPSMQKLTEPRRRLLKKRLSDVGGIDGWRIAMEKAAASDFLCGRTDKHWNGCNIDFLIRADIFTKLMEGNYDNRTGNGNIAGTPRANGNGHGSGLFDAFAAVAADLEGKPH